MNYENSPYTLHVNNYTPKSILGEDEGRSGLVFHIKCWDLVKETATPKLPLLAYGKYLTLSKIDKI
jgi:hypothetical protein